MSNLFESSAIGDIIDVIGAFSDVIMDDDSEGLGKIIQRKFGGSNPYRGSITSQANKLVMTFPVLMSDTINPHTALMISKAIERKMVVMLQMLFASSVFSSVGKDGRNANQIQDVINHYYTGIDFKTMSVDDVVKVMERLDLTESMKQQLKFKIMDATKALQEANLAALRMPVQNLEVFEEEGIDRFSVTDKGVKSLSEADRPKHRSVRQPRKFDAFGPDDSAAAFAHLAQAVGIDTDISTWNEWQWRTMTSLMNHSTDLYKQDNQRIAFEYQRAHDKYKDDVEWQKFLASEKDSEAVRAYRAAQLKSMEKRDQMALKQFDLQVKQYQNQLAGQRLDFMKKQLLDSDVKKANEMVPSMLVVDFWVETDGDPIKGTGIVGVKTRIVPVTSAEICDRIASKNKAKAGLVNLIRATTGETRFMKDFVLNIDRAKVDAVARSKRGSVNPMWRVLERRANKQALRRALAQKNDASPITTLVLTAEEVDYLKKTQAIDLNNVSIASDMLDAYNLMGLGIVDESAEVIKWMWDGEMKGFEPVSFLAMEKEDRDNGGMYKKVINMMARHNV